MKFGVVESLNRATRESNYKNFNKSKFKDGRHTNGRKSIECNMCDYVTPRINSRWDACDASYSNVLLY